MREDHLRQIWEKTQGHCHFCGDLVDFEKRGWHDTDLTGYWEVDHVIQRGKGGNNSKNNCLPACTRCNRLRWHRTGEKIRELLIFGLIVQDEITQGTNLGKSILGLMGKRSLKNQKRRK